ncbi:hypothetical protein F5B22DRAFT_400423 [Xylaria bambusicola]|uniref:uncharacterized protein n=1 Tax=Xylaria bambusicola TaxID=326684 RepID=UPI002008031D|nr:uncharacterized protein F5B22DRAFT_400423 [Xylaria bambusicola]KAI0508517.1 hypothetical protein F5B22DRAFT_400423 [Xylaria bambusicola]
MHFPSALLILLQSGLSAAAPLIPSLLSIRDTFTPPTVLSASFSGNGCPQGSTDAPTGGLWEHSFFKLPSFKAKIGPSSSVTERTVNCQGHISIGGSTGWQFALKDHWSKGYLEIEGAGVTLTQYVTVYFSQNPAKTATTVQSVPSTDDSGLSKELKLHSTIPEDALIWSPCDNSGILNVNFRMAFTSTASNSSAYYGASKNSSVTEQWGWAWRRC